MAHIPKGSFFFDFDSTIYPRESLDEILTLSLKDHPDCHLLQEKISKICSLGMEGKIDIQTSIEQRLSLAKINKATIGNYIAKNDGIQPEVIKLLRNLQEQGYRIFILSNGFKEWIVPLCQKTSIASEDIIANSFEFDQQNYALLDHVNRPLLVAKNLVIQNLKQLKKAVAPVFMVGDSITDAKAKSSGAADYFVAWTLYVQRPGIKDVADRVVSRVAEFEQQVFSLL